MAPRETENNAYPKFWGDKQRGLWSGQYYCGLLWVLFIKNDVWIFVGFTLEAKSVSSKLLIQVHLEILSCSMENMASHLLAKYITWSKSCESLGSLESWKRCTYTAESSLTAAPSVHLKIKMAAINGRTRYISTISRKNRDCGQSTFYPFTLGFKYTYIILEALEWLIVVLTDFLPRGSVGSFESSFTILIFSESFCHPRRFTSPQTAVGSFSRNLTSPR